MTSMSLDIVIGNRLFNVTSVAARSIINSRRAPAADIFRAARNITTGVRTALLQCSTSTQLPLHVACLLFDYIIEKKNYDIRLRHTSAYAAMIKQPTFFGRLRFHGHCLVGGAVTPLVYSNLLIVFFFFKI